MNTGSDPGVRPRRTIFAKSACKEDPVTDQRPADHISRRTVRYQLPGMEAVRVDRDQRYGESDAHLMDLYHPPGAAAGSLPAVITVQTGINEPRYASLKGIMAAKKKEIRTVALKDLGLDAAEVGGRAARLRTVRLASPPKGKGAEILKGPADEIARELVKRIREKTGVI